MSLMTSKNLTFIVALVTLYSLFYSLIKVASPKHHSQTYLPLFICFFTNRKTLFILAFTFLMESVSRFAVVPTVTMHSTAKIALLLQQEPFMFNTLAS